MKKTELVQMLTAFFDRTASAEPNAYEPYERGRTWLPEIMTFPADPAAKTEAAEYAELDRPAMRGRSFLSPRLFCEWQKAPR